MRHIEKEMLSGPIRMGKGTKQNCTKKHKIQIVNTHVKTEKLNLFSNKATIKKTVITKETTNWHIVLK